MNRVSNDSLSYASTTVEIWVAAKKVVEAMYVSQVKYIL